MAITAPQGVVRDAAAIARRDARALDLYRADALGPSGSCRCSTRATSRLSSPIRDSSSDMQLAGQTKLLGWLVGSLFISYGIAAPVWGWTVTRYGPRDAIMASLVIWALTCFWSGVSQSYGMLLASRIGLGVGEAACYPVTLRFGRQLVCTARARQGDVLLVDRHHDRADADRSDRHRPDRLLRLARTILCDGRSRAHPAAADGVVPGARQAGAASCRQSGRSRSGAGRRDREQRRCAGPRC